MEEPGKVRIYTIDGNYDEYDRGEWSEVTFREHVIFVTKEEKVLANYPLRNVLRVIYE